MLKMLRKYGSVAKLTRIVVLAGAVWTTSLARNAEADYQCHLVDIYCLYDCFQAGNTYEATMVFYCWSNEPMFEPDYWYEQTSGCCQWA